MISCIENVDQKIVEMRRDKHNGLFVIHKWLLGWDNFNNLDEMVVLAHILNILKNNGLEFNRKEVRKCFNRYYDKEFHLGRESYLNWLSKIGCD